MTHFDSSFALSYTEFKRFGHWHGIEMAAERYDVVSKVVLFHCVVHFHSRDLSLHEEVHHSFILNNRYCQQPPISRGMLNT